ncbi:pathogenesis-related protein 1-like [Lotus japonicus]|uniref:pathogenesis-related protein 1-like n=1 Tax=Lotus japonicus TaxID=34305 RepID=UPI002583E87F|nr:pathogenesis-related protein 1-like [Lotus japonicus]
MGVPNISTLLPLIAILAIVTFSQTGYAQDSPADYLEAQNRFRSYAGVAPLVWDQNLANYGKNYLNRFRGSCEMEHSQGGPYTENLAWGFPDLTGTAAVDMWVNEWPHYDYNSNSCIGGECRHYTQVVWRDTLRVGCAKVRCDNNRGTLISCTYDPKGNYIGQRPFDISPFEVPLSFKHHDKEVVVEKN